MITNNKLYEYPLNVLVTMSKKFESVNISDKDITMYENSNRFKSTFDAIAMITLSDIEYEFLLRYYRDGLTLREIAEERDLSHERIRQLIKRAMKKLANPDVFACFSKDLLKCLIEQPNLLKSAYDAGKEDGYKEGYNLGCKTAHEEAYRKGFNDCRECRISEFKISIEELPDLPIEDVRFSIRTYNLLKRNEINTLIQIAKMSPAKLHKLKSMGTKTYTEVVSVLRSYGIDTTKYEEGK